MMKLKGSLYSILLLFIVFTQVKAQQNRSSWDSDTTKRTFTRQETEKGPNKGKMVTGNGLKLEMVTPSKGDDVSYFLYDSINRLVDAKLYKGTVKYIFGGANEFLEANLNSTAVINKLIARLEGWGEYKRAVAVLKSGNKVYTFYFFNTDTMPSGQGNGQGNQGHHGRGVHGGGAGRQGGFGGGQGGGNGY